MARQEIQNKSQVLGALNDTIDINVAQQDATTLMIIGTFVGTLTFFGSDNGTDFVPIVGVALDSTARTTGVATVTAGGKGYEFRSYPLKTLRVRMTAYTSGSATVRSSCYSQR